MSELFIVVEHDSRRSAAINQTSRELAEFFGLNHKKNVMPVLFAAIQGKLQGPPLFDPFEIFGKDRARARLLDTIQFMWVVSENKRHELKKAWDRKTLPSNS